MPNTYGYVKAMMSIIEDCIKNKIEAHPKMVSEYMKDNNVPYYINKVVGEEKSPIFEKFTTVFYLPL